MQIEAREEWQSNLNIEKRAKKDEDGYEKILMNLKGHLSHDEVGIQQESPL